MRPVILALAKLGPLPAGDINTDVDVIEQYGNLLDSITKPLTDEEARILVTLFGPDDCFGLAWTLLHLIETAPSWPIEACLHGDNEWVVRLKRRVENARCFQREAE